MSKLEIFRLYVKKIHLLLMLLFLMFIVSGVGLIIYMIYPGSFDFKSTYYTTTISLNDDDRIENGIHLRTGLIAADGLMVVVDNCTTCHSSKLVTQNRMTTERWNETIKWMQDTQNLWDLGLNQEIIINYLVKNYPIKSKGRRSVLVDIEWYELEY